MRKSFFGFALIFIFAYFLGSVLNPHVVYVEKVITTNYTYPGGHAWLYVPAVDSNGNGVIGRIDVIAMPGTGRTLTDIENMFFWIDTQDSIRTARKVAANITGIDIDKYDLIYEITANASVIEGPSAGAALTVATIAALQNKNLRHDITITGTINEDGTIGPAGAILQKARAAANADLKKFLIPKGVLQTERTERIESCKMVEGEEICEVKYVPKKPDEKELGIKIQEVRTIREVLEQFV